MRARFFLVRFRKESCVSVESNQNFDLRKALAKNRLVGLWRLMSGYQWHYLFATICLGIAAMAKTTTYLLLRYFADNYFPARNAVVPLYMIALGFVGLAFIEGGFSFKWPLGCKNSGKHHPSAAQFPLRPHPAFDIYLP